MEEVPTINTAAFDARGKLAAAVAVHPIHSIAF
jgi:hypothetical protein